MLFIVAQRCHN